MLEVIRKHAHGWIAKVVLGLITVPFALWGIDFYFQGSGGEPAVATVDGDQISQREFVRALKSERDTMQKQARVKVDMDSRDFRESVLKQLVNTRLLTGTALRNGLRASQPEVDAMIHSAPMFQENGGFSQARFDAWLREQSLSEKELSRLIREDALTRQMQFGYGEGAVAGPAVADRLAGLLAQQREVNEAIFDSSAFATSVSIDDQAVQAEYNAHKPDFAIPARVRLQYLILSAETMQGQVNLGADAARHYYEANKARFQEPEQRHASHILIKADAGMSEADRQAAKAKAEKVFQEAKAGPAKFADLAKQNSADPGSAGKGGDLGSFTRDMMVKPFADAVFDMKVGEIRGPVQSEFGYHVIRLDGIQPGKTTAFEAVKGEIVGELVRQEAQKKFAESAERFSNLVYEQPNSLEPAAKEFKLELRESSWVDRGRAEPGFLANPQLMDAVFAPEAMDKHQNTEAVEVASGVLVSARVIEHKPAGIKPLAEVASDIRARLTQQAARAKAVEAGQQALKELQAGQTVGGMGPSMLVSRMQPQSLPAPAIKAIFKVDAGKLPAGAGVETPQGYRLYRVARVLKVEADEARRKMLQRDLGRILAQEEMKAYLEYIRARADIKINNKVLEKKSD